MYTNEDRMKVIRLYIEYNYNARAVIRELGYPSRNRLAIWYQEYLTNGDFKSDKYKHCKYSFEQRQKAIDFYLNNGKSVQRTIKALGYPGKSTLCDWLNESVDNEKRKWSCKSSRSLVRCSHEQKEQAVKDYCTGVHTPTDLSKIYGVDPYTIYRWKDKLLGKETETSVPKKAFAKIGTKINNSNANADTLNKDKSTLEKEIANLQDEVRRLKLEKDILHEATKLAKKELGINLTTLNNREKAIIINALREKYLLKTLLEILHMAKSSYSYQIVAMSNDKYRDLRAHIKTTFNDAKSRYGYRRIHTSMKNTGITVSEKVIRRLMKDEKLVALQTQRKKFNSYKGEISPAVENIIERDFRTDIPNTKWLTDITEFRIPAGKVYLSPIIDCFDGLPISWTIGVSPDANLVNTMLDEAISILDESQRPILHSDRGSHYRWPGWIERVEKAGIIRSMSKKGCSPDNAACEGFFGRLKTEMFYGQSWVGVTIGQFIEILDDYIKWYAEKRIKISLGGLSPMEYRRSLGLIV